MREDCQSKCSRRGEWSKEMGESADDGYRSLIRSKKNTADNNNNNNRD